VTVSIASAFANWPAHKIRGKQQTEDNAGALS